MSDDCAKNLPHTADDGRLRRPGFGLPIDTSTRDKYENWETWVGQPVTVRERYMTAVIDKITDKQDWRRKVFDDGILEHWKHEALSANEDFSEEMFNFCVRELQYKAGLHQDTDMTLVFNVDGGVAKSDSAISPAFKEEINASLRPLEDVPDHRKDWHPYSNQQVLDLVHPSLYPLVYGRTRVLPYHTIGLEDCLKNCCSGEVAEVPSEDQTAPSRSWMMRNNMWSKKFQWLPCEVRFAEDGSAKIDSYINNLHPVHHRHLYSVIERLIDAAIPLWGLVLGAVLDQHNHDRVRVPCTGAVYKYPNEELDEEGESAEDFDDHMQNRVLIPPEPRAFEPIPEPVEDLRQKFAQQGLQVIVKIATIHLEPESSSSPPVPAAAADEDDEDDDSETNQPPHSTARYAGGTWHVEGALNERICATALYYPSTRNTTPSTLSFRQSLDSQDLDGCGVVDYEQGDFEGIEMLFGVRDGGSAVQDIGTVSTPEGRLLAFPNTFQHRVGGFELADKGERGWRKVVALFLVDPNERVVSTANVGPQQKGWWAEEVGREGVGLRERLPAELVDAVVDEVRGEPMGVEEAREVRLEVMEERGALGRKANDYVIEEGYFSFCEH